MVDRPDDDFLARWSRRKRRASTGIAEPGKTVDDAASAPQTATARPGVSGPESAVEEAAGGGAPGDESDVVATLPDIDTMDDSSDFTVFLRDGVPEALRRRALRKLWRVNPVLANLDGLNNYDEDYTKLGMVDMPNLKTIYKIGRGMVWDDEPEPEVADAEAVEPESAEPAAVKSAVEPETVDSGTTEPETSEAILPGAGAAEASISVDEPAPVRAFDAAVPRVADRPASEPRAASRRWGRFRT